MITMTTLNDARSQTVPCLPRYHGEYHEYHDYHGCDYHEYLANTMITMTAMEATMITMRPILLGAWTQGSQGNPTK